ncbi:MAG: putative signal transducing protein [Pirellulales bacterium]
MEPAETDGGELVTAYTLKDPYKAEIIKNALRDEGIPCELDGEGQAGLSEIFDIAVLVRARDADLARELIEQHEQGTAESPERP